LALLEETTYVSIAPKITIYQRCRDHLLKKKDESDAEHRAGGGNRLAIAM